MEHEQRFKMNFSFPGKSLTGKPLLFRHKNHFSLSLLFINLTCDSIGSYPLFHLTFLKAHFCNSEPAGPPPSIT